MPNEEEMSINERRKYLKLVMLRYQKAGRKEKGYMLSEMEKVTQLHRKSLIRLMGLPSLARSPSKPRYKRRKYGPDVENVVRVVWESLDYICAERITPVLLQTAHQLARWEELRLTSGLEEKLSLISRPTVERMLTRFQKDIPTLPRRKPQPPNRLLRETPMKRLDWDTELPGSFETDLVHHCGEQPSGEYVHTLQLVDIATGWSERVAIKGRSQQAMVEGFKRVQKRLPFPIRHLHPDNGSEFFNDHLIRYFGEDITGLSLSRSRPYHKNDNRIVEQKNSTLVRAYIGYERLDSRAECDALNELYDQMWLYYNLFQPVMHMTNKEVISGRLQRKHDDAQTPYQRMLATGVCSAEHKSRLAELYGKTNPRKLRKDIYDAIDHLKDHGSSININQRKEGALAGNISK